MGRILYFFILFFSKFALTRVFLFLLEVRCRRRQRLSVRKRESVVTPGARDWEVRASGRKDGPGIPLLLRTPVSPGGELRGCSLHAGECESFLSLRTRLFIGMIDVPCMTPRGRAGLRWILSLQVSFARMLLFIGRSDWEKGECRSEPKYLKMDYVCSTYLYKCACMFIGLSVHIKYREFHAYNGMDRDKGQCQSDSIFLKMDYVRSTSL